MKTALSLVALWLLSLTCHATCGFKPSVQKVVSLSGPITVLLKETGLLRATAVKGISIFSPIQKRDFRGTIYPGGLFLARSTLAEFAGGVVFYDSGRELRKILMTQPGIRTIEVNSRDLLPLEVVDRSIDLLRGLTHGCEDGFKAFRDRARGLQDELLRSIPKGFKVVFFLGRFTGDRAPELVMANDGAVKLLRREKGIATYPSELAYVNWSARILASLPAKTLFVGLVDPSMDGEQRLVKSGERWTVTFPGILVPGSTQLAGLVYWVRGL